MRHKYINYRFSCIQKGQERRITITLAQPEDSWDRLLERAENAVKKNYPDAEEVEYIDHSYT